MEYFENFKGRNDLTDKYGDNALLLYALELRLQIEDIKGVATDALTDGNDDKKCDLVYISEEDGIAVIAQGYMSKKERKSAPSNKASDLNTAITWLLNENYDNLPIDIKAAAYQLRNALKSSKINTIQIWYVHNCPESENVKKELNAVKLSCITSIEQYLKEPINVIEIEVGNETLNKWYQSSSVPILVADELEIPTINGGYQVEGENWKSYMTSIPLTFLYDNYHKYKDDLFSSNIRGYLGSLNKKNNINNGIKRTVETKPSNFLIYNNGLTIVVNDIKEIKEKSIKIQGMSIVNGAQTTGAIGSVTSKPVENALVTVRFIKCDDQNILRDIIEYNNKQNVVESSDFRSTDEVQDRLRKEFETINNVMYLGGRRGGSEDKIKRYSNLIPHDVVAQCLTAYHQDPGTAYNRKKEIWRNNTLYSRIFSEKTSADHIIYVYSLYLAIENKKSQLKNKNKEGNLEKTEQEIHDFLIVRGAVWLLIAAVSSGIDSILGIKIKDQFSLCFKSDVSLENAVDLWEIPLNIISPFVSSLIPAVQDGLNTREVIKSAIKDCTEKTASMLSIMKVTPGVKENIESFSSKIDF
ncbi:AIPR family protein [Bacillus atrophaeus]|uniref:AIPR family protein n=1 Tax=Bacillus atrophaeus TaxID=1452 RepID=UPI00227E088D|nr:AIPR family protein [Bacillus atrophaeus]MCY8840453.1 AIPR family protein [Bacillus atrophaeus]MEC0803604.1 AIPR family protein [Bacillus atrophaeus]MEC0854201.1 AIPR family protein [Bacillus atrophaeus]MEC0857403.1 AIPR family protein [Bacillus atrophaeus]MEC0860910.1 AIPR family protein [Bacillus atrophaeus]